MLTRTASKNSTYKQNQILNWTETAIVCDTMKDYHTEKLSKLESNIFDAIFEQTTPLYDTLLSKRRQR